MSPHPTILGLRLDTITPWKKTKQINMERQCFFWKKIRTSTFWGIELKTSTVPFSDIMYLIKGILIRSLAFLKLFLFFSKIRQIFSDIWFWVCKNKLKVFYILRIGNKNQYCWYSNCHENSIFKFGEYSSESLLTFSFYLKLFDKILLWQIFFWTSSFCLVEYDSETKEGQFDS